jgi:hypothetical protein
MFGAQSITEDNRTLTMPESTLTLWDEAGRLDVMLPRK